MRPLTTFSLCVCIHLAFVTSTAVGQDLISYDQGWRYAIADRDLGNPILNVFMDPSYNDSGWPIGIGPFGSGVLGEGTCPLQAYAQTGWGSPTRLLLRTRFEADPGVPLIGHFAVDNDVVGIWVNGILVASAGHDGCPVRDEFFFTVPSAVLNRGSANVIAVHASNNGSEAYFELRLTPEAATPAARYSWGRVRALYR